MFHSCVPGSRLGIGGVLGELAWDPATRRTAVRWAGLAAVWNLVGSPNGMAYVRGHLDLAIGVDAESVWHGGGDPRTGSDHVGRAVIALAGLQRSASARWEVDASVAALPVVVGTTPAFRDFAALAEAALLYHMFVGASSVVSIGLDARTDYWSDPAMSIGPFDRSTRKASLFAGVVVQVRHESPR
jgi:hypothetical protein